MVSFPCRFMRCECGQLKTGVVSSGITFVCLACEQLRIDARKVEGVVTYSRQGSVIRQPPHQPRAIYRKQVQSEENRQQMQEQNRKRWEALRSDHPALRP